MCVSLCLCFYFGKYRQIVSLTVVADRDLSGNGCCGSARLLQGKPLHFECETPLFVCAETRQHPRPDCKMDARLELSNLLWELEGQMEGGRQTSHQA